MSSLLEELSAVAQSSSLPAFQRLVERQAHRLGFERYGVAVVTDQADGTAVFSTVANIPDGYRSSFEDAKLHAQDPVMELLKKSSVPLAWDKSVYLAKGQEGTWDHQNHYGYGSGFAAAFHLPKGRHVVVGFDKAGTLPDSQSKESEAIGEFLVFSSFSIDAALSLIPAPQARSADAPSSALTKREAEVLRWTLAGKTAWEVGEILSISDRTVHIHAGNAMRKLDCVNKNQAALKALRQGLIQV
jgi:DNA-binding CsgD family transcriptional regulator